MDCDELGGSHSNLSREFNFGKYRSIETVAHTEIKLKIITLLTDGLSTAEPSC
jgi:hypothetical protein